LELIDRSVSEKEWHVQAPTTEIETHLTDPFVTTGELKIATWPYEILCTFQLPGKDSEVHCHSRLSFPQLGLHLGTGKQLG
jgi:hypothetical protein